jgi:hypothetical protein
MFCGECGRAAGPRAVPAPGATSNARAAAPGSAAPVRNGTPAGSRPTPVDPARRPAPAAPTVRDTVAIDRNWLSAEFEYAPVMVPASGPEPEPNTDADAGSRLEESPAEGELVLEETVADADSITDAGEPGPTDSPLVAAELLDAELSNAESSGADASDAGRSDAEPSGAGLSGVGPSDVEQSDPEPQDPAAVDGVPASVETGPAPSDGNDRLALRAAPPAIWDPPAPTSRLAPPVASYRDDAEDNELTRIVPRRGAGVRFVLQFSTGERSIRTSCPDHRSREIRVKNAPRVRPGAGCVLDSRPLLRQRFRDSGTERRPAAL